MFVKILDIGPVAESYLRNERQLCVEIGTGPQKMTGVAPIHTVSKFRILRINFKGSVPVDSLIAQNKGKFTVKYKVK